MSDQMSAGMSSMVMAGALVKRPAMFMGTPTRFDRMTAFIAGFTMAIETTRAALSAGGTGAFRPAPVESQFADQLREEGRLRWNRWDLTIAAEAIGWASEEPPVIDEFTEEQHQAAINALAPLLELVRALPIEVVAGADSRSAAR
jgi:hypothetical protein